MKDEVIQELARLYEEVLNLSPDEFERFEIDLLKSEEEMLHSFHKQVAHKRDYD